MMEAGGRDSLEEQRWTGRVILRYALFQVPEIIVLVCVLLLVETWISLPRLVFWGILALAVVKDIVLFPVVWKAYDDSPSDDSQHMAGQNGIACGRLDPEGYVFVDGEQWRAQIESGEPPVEKGDTVTVVEVRGLTLVVRADPSRTHEDS
jgi:membrane-bound ClpP family serine protease